MCTRDNCSSKDAPKLRRALMEVGLVVEPGDVDKILHAYADPRLRVRMAHIRQSRPDHGLVESP